MNNNVSIKLQCLLHNNDFIALCLTCGEGLCLDCLFDHQSFKDHHYEKIEKLKEKYKLDLTKMKELTLENQKKSLEIKDKNSLTNINENINKIDKFQTEFKNNVDNYFKIIKEQYQEFIRILNNNKTSKISQEKLNLAQNLNEIDLFLKDLSEDNDNSLFKISKFLKDNEKVKEIPSEKIINSTNSDQNISSKNLIHLSIKKENSLSRIPNILSQSLSFIDKKINITEDRTKFSILPWFLENTNLLYIYDIKEKKVNQFLLKDFIVPFNHRIIVRDNNQIFLLGGIKTDNEKVSNEILTFDPKTSTMRTKFNMKTARFGFAVCYLNTIKEEFIYCLGGKSQDERLNSVERYSINENTWKIMAKMNGIRVGGSSCCNQKYIYLFGGINENEIICKNIDVYSIQENKWEVLNLINDIFYEPTIDSSCLFINDHEIIIVGGARKENSDIYFTNNVIFLNTEENYIFSHNQKQDFPYYFLGDILCLNEKNIYMLIKLRTESKKYGPFQKGIITLDLNRNIWKFDQLIESENSNNN